MKFIYKAALLICSSVFAMSVQAAGMPQSSKPAQRGVNCTQCHTCLLYTSDAADDV